MFECCLKFECRCCYHCCHQALLNKASCVSMWEQFPCSSTIPSSHRCCPCFAFRCVSSCISPPCLPPPYQVMLSNSVVVKEESDWIEYYYRCVCVRALMYLPDLLVEHMFGKNAHAAYVSTQLDPCPPVHCFWRCITTKPNPAHTTTIKPPRSLKPWKHYAPFKAGPDAGGV